MKVLGIGKLFTFAREVGAKIERRKLEEVRVRLEEQFREKPIILDTFKPHKEPTSLSDLFNWMDF